MRALRTTDLSAMINVRMPECAFSNASSRGWEAAIKGDLVLLVRRYQRSDHSPRPGFPPCRRRRSSSNVDQPVAKENAEVSYRRSQSFASETRPAATSLKSTLQRRLIISSTACRCPLSAPNRTLGASSRGEIP